MSSESNGDQHQARAVDEPVPSSTQAPTLYIMVVAFLGVALIGSLAGAIALAILGQPVPDGVIALGAGSMGALGGLLAPSPVR